MSHAPVCRKSQQALSAAASIAASTKPAPHLVVLRVKRKRGDASVDSLLVSTDEATSNENDVPDRKRRAGTETIEDTLAFLSINKAAEEKRQHQVDPKPSRLFYKRVRTTESDGSDRKETTSRVVAPPNDEHGHVETAGTGGGRLDTRLVSDAGAPPIPPPPNALDYLEVRRIKARAVGTAVDSGRGSGHGVPSSSDVASNASDFHVIDLQAVGRSGNGMDVTDTVDTAFGGKTAATPSAAPVLNPVERQMDEAIFEAFQTGDLSSLHAVLASFPDTINFRRRLGDGTTALMAAAFHGNLDTVRHLLSLGAKASLADAGGKSAALIAGMRGHRACFAELQRAADEERSAGSRRKGGGPEDFVYDLYYFEPPTSRSPAAPGGETVGGGQADDVAPAAPGEIGEKTPDTTNAPVVCLSGIGPVDENAVWTTGIELKFEHDSDWSELGDGDAGEDPDSNSEGFHGNDYPEDEGDNDGTGGPYIYAGSSCPSEDGSSSDGRLDSDNDIDPRRVLHAHGSAFDRLADVASFSEDSEHRLGQTLGASEGVRTFDNPFRTGLGDAEALAYGPQPSDGESSSDDL